MTTNTEAPKPRALAERDAAIYAGVSTAYLRQARMLQRGTGRTAITTPGPRFVQIGRSIRYLIDDLDSWLESHRVGGGDDQEAA